VVSSTANRSARATASRTARRVSNGLRGPLVLVVAGWLLVACGSGAEAPTATPAAGGPAVTSLASSPAASATAAALTRSEAAARYKALADTYRRAKVPLDKALDERPIDMATIRSTAAVAAAAFRARIAGLLETTWPADVRPLIDDFVTKAARGLNTLNAAAKAKSLEDIVAAGSKESADTINAADTLIRVKLGLPTVDG
jgi:hypothetical protein